MLSIYLCMAGHPVGVVQPIKGHTLRKSNYPSSGSHRLSSAPQLGVEAREPLPPPSCNGDYHGLGQTAAAAANVHGAVLLCRRNYFNPVLSNFCLLQSFLTLLTSWDWGTWWQESVINGIRTSHWWPHLFSVFGQL